MTLFNFIRLGWNIGFIIGSYLIAKRKVSGFYCFAFANTLYIISGFFSSSYKFIFDFYLFSKYEYLWNNKLE